MRARTATRSKSLIGRPTSANLISIAALLCLGLFNLQCAKAEDGSAAWLRYAPLQNPGIYSKLPTRIIVIPDSPRARVAAEELARGLKSMLGRRFEVSSAASDAYASTGAIEFRRSVKDKKGMTVKAHGRGNRSGISERLRIEDRFKITSQRSHGQKGIRLEGNSDRALIYAAFRLLEEVASERPLPREDLETPAVPIRWVDEWDNLDGSIERGYAGRSIFFDAGHVRSDLNRAGEYARLLASIGINGCNVNNVNADLGVLSSSKLHEMARLADAFRPWGVRLALSVDLTSPQTVGGLSSFDPLDPKVEAWWREKSAEIYREIPDFGGFTVKADSEGRRGPSQYGRSPADAANVLAKAIESHGGVVMYRGFVYNNHLDWADLKADRARAGVDNFARYDGRFEPNVVIQIKEGPIDFQAREPVSPLFAALRKTGEAIEVQTSQEYTGQQSHMVWLPSMWKWALDTDLRLDNNTTPLRSILQGRSALNRGFLGGFVSVTNVGLDANWLHHPMAMANLYGFGKLAWNPEVKLEDIIDLWTRMTWGNDDEVVSTIVQMQRNSWHVYEQYTGPNGMGTLTNILGVHFGPGIESAEHNGWGQWFRADQEGIGMDRTTATGTGFAGQYPPQLAAQYASPTNCPEELLLFFHHVAYDYLLRSGKSLVQSIYDSHYLGAEAANNYLVQWEKLRGKIDAERHTQVRDLFDFQAGHAIVWRDAINTWFLSKSGIADSQGRVSHDPNRIEAESMAAQGYVPVSISPVETASRGQAVVCGRAQGCTLQMSYDGATGNRNVAVQYFDLRTGISHYKLTLNDRQVAAWAAGETLPPAEVRPVMDGQTSTRFTVRDLPLKTGDTLSLEGIPDMSPNLAMHGQVEQVPEKGRETRELAPVDYLEFGPPGPGTPQ